MQMHVRTEATAADTAISHHGECDKDHDIIMVKFTVTTEHGGRAVDSARDCLLMEMEDTVQYAIMDAYETSDYIDLFSIDEDEARALAAELAADADALDVGDYITRYCDVS